MLRKAARREFIAIITLDGLIEAALRTRCLAPAREEMCVRESETMPAPYTCTHTV